METQGYKVEKGIPVPPKKSGRPKKKVSKYPFAQMNVGDSFCAAAKDRVKIASAAVTYRKTKKRTAKFTTRVEGKLARIWRVA